MAHVNLDCDVSYAKVVDEVHLSDGDIVVEMHSATDKSSDAVKCSGVDVAYFGHGPSLENVEPV